MSEYFAKHYDKLLQALWEHLEIVALSVLFSLIIAAIFVIACNYSKVFGKVLVNVFSVVYSVPSLALFALMIPLTGLGTTTAIIVLIIYNEYLLLRNFLGALNEVDPAIVEAATGLGMTKMQVLVKIRLPLAKKSLFGGLRIAVVSTIGIATIAASVNAGGLGTILFDGLRTMNIEKILWGSIFSAGLAVLADLLLTGIEKLCGETHRKRRRKV